MCWNVIGLSNKSGSGVYITIDARLGGSAAEADQLGNGLKIGSYRELHSIHQIN